CFHWRYRPCKTSGCGKRPVAPKSLCLHTRHPCGAQSLPSLLSAPASLSCLLRNKPKILGQHCLPPCHRDNRYCRGKRWWGRPGGCRHRFVKTPSTITLEGKQKRVSSS